MPSKDKPHHEHKKPKAGPKAPQKLPKAGPLPLSISRPVMHPSHPDGESGA